jgi:hypothetical protein
VPAARRDVADLQLRHVRVDRGPAHDAREQDVPAQHALHRARVGRRALHVRERVRERAAQEADALPPPRVARARLGERREREVARVLDAAREQRSVHERRELRLARDARLGRAQAGGPVRGERERVVEVREVGAAPEGALGGREGPREVLLGDEVPARRASVPARERARRGADLHSSMSAMSSSPARRRARSAFALAGSASSQRVKPRPAGSAATSAPVRASSYCHSPSATANSVRVMNSARRGASASRLPSCASAIIASVKSFVVRSIVRTSMRGSMPGSIVSMTCAE